MRKTWTDDEESLLKRLVGLGLSNKEISKAIKGRNVNQVKGHINDMRRNGDMEAHEPKVFVFDIETSTIIYRVFSPKTNYISHKNMIRDWFVLSWAGRWLGTDEIISDVLTPREARRGVDGDKRICKSLWDIFNKADILVAHNGDRFDIKKMNYRWKYHRFNPPLPYRTIDTLKVHRSTFGATSNALDFIVKQMKLNEAKHLTGFQLWVDCEEGNKDALKRMDEYCRHDIELGELLYLDIRKWAKSGVNFGLYSDMSKQVCSRCGGDIEIQEKEITTGANKYKTYRCLDCGHADRTKESTITPEQRKNLVL